MLRACVAHAHLLDTALVQLELSERERVLRRLQQPLALRSDLGHAVFSNKPVQSAANQQEPAPLALLLEPTGELCAKEQTKDATTKMRRKRDDSHTQQQATHRVIHSCVCFSCAATKTKSMSSSLSTFLLWLSFVLLLLVQRMLLVLICRSTNQTHTPQRQHLPRQSYACAVLVKNLQFAISTQECSEGDDSRESAIR